jgi:RES domain
MTLGIEPVRPEGQIYRLGRRPEPWAWPDWAYAGGDGTFGNRYDDPHSQYRVLYASSRRLGALLETLARFRPDPAIVVEEVAGDPRDARYETMRPCVVPEQ